MSEPAESNALDVVRSYFDEHELRAFDDLAAKIVVIVENGLATRKFEKWAGVLQFRFTQLATAVSFGLSAKEVAKIKGAYLHAQGKTAGEANTIIRRSGITVSPPGSRAAGPRLPAAPVSADVSESRRPLSAELFEGQGEEAYAEAAVALLEPEQRPSIPLWASELMVTLYPLLISNTACARWKLSIVESATVAFSFVRSEDWSTVERGRVQTYLADGLPAMCADEHGRGPSPTLQDDEACERCAAGMLSRHPDGAPIRELFAYLRAQPAWERLLSTGLMDGGAIAQLAAEGRLLQGRDKHLFEDAIGLAVRIGSAPAFVLCLRDLGLHGPAGGELEGTRH